MTAETKPPQAQQHMPQDPNRNAWLARHLCAAFAQAGVAGAVLSPGNRNVPLLFALQHQFPTSHYVHIDERSAAFIALGMAKQLRAPVIVNMTSGSAVANVLPALCEAHAAHIPLIILSADRPDYLHGSGAPQCMQQQHIFKDFVAHSLHFDFSAADVASLHLALMQINNALEACHGPCPAAIHINIGFDEPLAPLADPDWQQPDEQILNPEKNPFNAAISQSAYTSATPSEQIIAALQNKHRGLIICGPDAPISRADLKLLAAHTGFPVIADAASNLRHAEIPHLISSADVMLLGDLAAQPADLLIRIGAAPISRGVYEYCARQACPVIRIDSHAVRKDFLHPQFLLLQAPSSACIHALATACTPETGTTGAPDVNGNWKKMWLDAETQAHRRMKQFLDTSTWGEYSAAALICRQQLFPLIQCANSMAIRHANLFASAQIPQQFISHRGVNGIDGSLGSFIGASLASHNNTLLLCGDIAFLHDLPALSAAHLIRRPACIVVINNNGGRIFDILPAAACPGFQQLLTTSRDTDIQSLAAGFKIPSSRCTNADELHQALSSYAQLPQLSIIEVIVPADSLQQQWPTLKTLFLDVK